RPRTPPFHGGYRGSNPLGDASITRVPQAGSSGSAAESGKWCGSKKSRKQRPPGAAFFLFWRRVTVPELLKTFVRAQIAPLPRRQVPQLDAPDAHPLQAQDFQADGFAHAPDLAL